jgi:dTDP-4-amino-4,6-dideoxygalactose transaminase
MMNRSTHLNIPYWRTSFDNGENELIAKALQNEHVSQGPIVGEFEKQIANYLGVPYVVATTSGTSALLMSLMAAGIKPGDEVIIPNRTWIATAHAPFALGAVIKLVDVEITRPIIDSSLIEQAITEKTKAIIPVHLCGRSADMRKINAIARKHNLAVIEDAAQALGSRNEDGLLGIQSDMGCFSLSVAKIISTGQGGFIATKSEDNYRKLISIRTQGVGDVINAKWRELGLNFRFTDILAAIGVVQVGLLEKRIKKLEEIYEMYERGLKNIPFLKLIPVELIKGEVPVYVEVLCKERSSLINYLAKMGIQCRPFYPNIEHAEYLNIQGSYPNSKKYEEEGVFLPCGPEQNLDNIKLVIEALNSYAKTM